MACIANQGKAIGDNPPDNLHDKNAACYSARQDQPFPFMRPVLMFVAMLVFDVIIVYAMNVFDVFSPVKLGWVLKDKTQRLLFFTHPSIPSQEGTSQIPLLRGVGVCCGNLTHPFIPSPCPPLHGEDKGVGGSQKIEFH